MYSVNAGLDAAKRKGVTVASTKDGRLQLSLSFAATLSWGKVAFVCSVMLLCLGYLAAPLFGVESMRRRVVQLEQRMSQKLSWVLRNKDKLKADLGHVGAPALHADGRQHLLTPPGAMSKLAEAISPNTALADFDDHYLCGDREVTEAEVTRRTIALAAISWMAPKSLRNSMESWRMNGLLDIADEKMIFLNSPTAEDRSIASEFGFDVYTTDERGGNVMAGPSLAYLAGNSTADYLLLLEKDFVLSAPRDVMMREMYTGVQHLARGVDAYRLRGKSDYPAEGMPNCCEKRDPPTCPYHSNWRSAGYFGDHMNWLLILCDPDIMEHSNGRLAQCTKEPNAPTSYCFTSGETNWSNNPILFPRTWFNDKIRDIALMDFERNNMFEFNTMMSWLSWKPPARICMSEQGIFTHNEIDQ